MPKGHSDLALATAQRTTIPSVPFRTPMFGADGNMTRTWILFFEQLGGAFTQIMNGGGAGLWGGVNIQVSSYAAQATDDGLLIVFAVTAAATFQLPSKPPSTKWKVFVENAGTAAVTVLPNGDPLLDGNMPSGILEPGQGVYISTDGTNYFTERGLVPAFETNGTPNATQGLLNLVAGANVTLTDDGAGDITIASTASGSGSGGVNAQTASYTAVSGDDGKLISFSSTSATALTFTLPATPPSATWSVHVENAGIHSSATVPGELSIPCPTGVYLDGVFDAQALVLCVGQGIYITTDGTNYFTERGGPFPGSVIAGNTTGAAAVLTITKTDSGGGPSLNVLSEDTEATIVNIAATPTGGFPFTGTALEVAGNAGNGIVVSNLHNGYGGVALGASTGAGIAISATSAHTLRASIETANSTAGPDIAVNGYILFGLIGGGGVSFTRLTTNAPTGINSCQNGVIVFCGDAKNFTDDLAPVGSIAAGGGHGAMVCKCNGTWKTMC